MSNSLAQGLKRLRQESRPVRFLLSRGLWHTCLGRLLGLRIRLPDGVSIAFHPTAMAASLWLNPLYGADDTSFLRRYLAPGDAVIDVGANIGALTLSAARHVGPTGRVLAIEPHPRTFTFLLENAAAAGATNVSCLNCAVGSERGKVYMSDLRSDDQNAVIEGAGLRVNQFPLDELASGFERVALLKIDTEGYERFVLEGARLVLARTACVYFECSESTTRRYGYHPRDLIDFLDAEGLAVHRLTDGALSSVDPKDIGQQPENLIAIRDAEEFTERFLAGSRARQLRGKQ